MVFRLASREIKEDDNFDVRDRELTESQVEVHLERPVAAFTLPNDPAYLSNYQATVARQRIEKLHMPEEARLKLQIALAEAVENAITHGSAGDASKPIQVVFEETDEEFRISVRDQGAGFDAERILAGAEEVDALEATRDRAQFGAGIGLRMILDCVDRLQFETPPDGGCVVHMAKYKEESGMVVIEDDEPEPSGDPDITID
jgi:serine/threonine-protein kinase RsbW